MSHDPESLIHFIEKHLPGLVASGDIVLHCTPGTNEVRLFATCKNAVAEIADGKALGINLIASQEYLSIRNRLVGTDDKEGNRALRRFTAGADAFSAATLQQMRVEDYHTHTLIHGPVLLWTDEGYRPVPRGVCRALRTFSYVEPIKIAPIRGESPIQYFFNKLRLSEENRALVAAFYIGLIIRPAFDFMPMLFVRSPWKKTGKTTICNMAQRVQGVEKDKESISWKGDREFEKAMPARDGSCRLFSIDNVGSTGRSDFKCDIINSATQSRGVKVRLLGHSVEVPIDRPSFCANIQNGSADRDLIDRLLYVFLDSAPNGGALTLQSWVPKNADALRSELAAAIMDTKPIQELDGPAASWRFCEFYRHVAPVLEKIGLDPSHLYKDRGEAFAADKQELLKCIYAIGQDNHREWVTADDIVRNASPASFPNLAASLGPDAHMSVKVAVARRLLRGDCTEHMDMAGRYRLVIEQVSNLSLARAKVLFEAHTEVVHA